MNVLGSSTANDGDVIQVDLPTNSIVDLSSLAWSFTTTYTGKAGQAPRGDGGVVDPTGANARSAAVPGRVIFPLNAESVIQRLTVEVNGQTLVNLNNYNTLWHALLYMTTTDDYLLQRRVAQSNAAAETRATGCRARGVDPALAIWRVAFETGEVDRVRRQVESHIVT